MNPTRSLALLLLASGALAAQAPIFADGAALGGSRVFSEGLNPMGNPARFDRPATGVYLGWAEGDEGAKDTTQALAALGNPLLNATDLTTLADHSWSLRTRALGLAYVDKGMYGAYMREETTGLLASPDLDPSRASLALNTTTAGVRRAVVDRVCLGAGSFDRGTGYGLSLRLERWKTGQMTAALNPLEGQRPLIGADLLAFQETGGSTKTSITADFGYVQELLDGVRFGFTVDRLIPRHFGDVYEGLQGRGGFQLDLGSTVTLSVDSDLNKAMRMPFPVRQRISAVSLRLAPNPAVTLILGAERRSLDGQPLIRGGATLFVHWNGWHVGAGFQAGSDRPMKGAALSVF